MRTEPTPAQQRSARAAFAALATAPAAARAFVRDSLGSWGLHTHTDTAELVISELVTNAVRVTATLHPSRSRAIRAAPLIWVELRADARTVHIAVRDDAGGRPVPRAPDADAESGRGLLLVTALCTRWYVTPAPGGGKVIHAELPRALP